MIEILETAWDSDLGRAAGALRVEVFVVEQRVAREIELDEHDAGAVHLVAVERDGEDQGKVVGTLRILEWDERAKIGRVAVRKDLRGMGIGLALMYEALRMIRAEGYQEVVLSAQVAVLGFYEKLGFGGYGEVFEEAGLPHRKMVMRMGEGGEV